MDFGGGYQRVDGYIPVLSLKMNMCMKQELRGQLYGRTHFT